MEGSIVKQGSLYFQHQQRFGKKWKKVWAVLHRPASSGVARLEMHEGSQPPESGRKLECWKLIQLSDCVSLSERGGENSPKDTRAFSIETAQRVFLLASETSEQPCWVRELCALAFPQERLFLERRCSQPQQSEGLRLQENVLYSTSRESSPGNQFVVRIRQTDASSRCSLSGMYTLSVDTNCLSLRDRQSGSLLYSWPYPFLRRFGRDKAMFSFEAGRRCTSGEGTFEFQTALGSQIFSAIETAISSHHNDLAVSSLHEYSKITNLGSWPPAPPSSLQKSISQPPPQVNLPGENHLPESDYAIPFDKVARNLLNTGFVGLLGPVPPAQGKIKKSRGAEHIYDEPEVPVNPVYDEPEEMKTDAWKTQGTDAHETGYEYPYLPGWDDYAVPRVGVTTSTKGKQKVEGDEWGSEVNDDREYDNITLKGSQKS
ncbi:docking protein 2 [Spea bombifrons]|uniref:docking protein 2 n=1 Tax=Spea bombifrons TaxID=233779 RepID=UPI00234A4751|nr:docking protein 2 [Spea bombifrons]XP_053321498.1 docking protein 2 [Spea bombifrons]XP_053321499.1 docking protein 2 [Spea bombifrons]XP_053321501.1 docking protein 2 [Spea bombifrons]